MITTQTAIGCRWPSLHGTLLFLLSVLLSQKGVVKADADRMVFFKGPYTDTTNLPQEDPPLEPYN